MTGIYVAGLNDFLRGIRAAEKDTYKDVLKAGRESAKIVMEEQQRRARGSLKTDIKVFSNQGGAGVTGGKKLVYFGVNEVGTKRGIYWHPGGGAFVPGKHAKTKFVTTGGLSRGGGGYIRVPINGNVRMSNGHRIRTKPYRATGYFFLPGFEAKKAEAAEHYWDALIRIIDKV